MKKCALLSLFLCLLVALSACTAKENMDIPTDGKMQIIATLFPQYDFTRQLVGDRATVTMLLPAGVESHSYDPTPSDIIKINQANLFIYTGKYMESWAETIINGLNSSSVQILDVSKNVSLSKAGEMLDHEEETTTDAHDHSFDPHIWTDPNNALLMVDTILEALCSIDEENAAYYRENAENYKAELLILDEELRAVVANGKRKEIVFGGKNAFHYFLTQYGLSYEGAYDSCAAEAEPSVRTVAHLIDEIKEKQLPVIYYEELTTPKVAQSISDETGAKMLLLHSAHNVSMEDLSKGITYLSIMKKNTQNLKEGLQ